ncbi:MAG: hypothetical protein HKO93_03450 [Flavobacteriales bacterium]|nr:hypothetical protein [Flavobacteriales bacterium]
MLQLGCEKDEDEESDNGGNNNPTEDTSSFEAKIDGVDFESETILIAGTSAGSGGLNARLASGTRFMMNGDTMTVAITATSFNAAAFEEGADFDASNGLLGDYCFGNVLINNGLTEIEADSEDTGQAQMTITAYDEINGTFSGTFSFVAEDDDNNVSYTVTEGIFTNVEFD